MSASPQYQAIRLFANIWETYKGGRKYFPTPKDFGAATTLLAYMIEPDDYIKRINEYLNNPRWTDFGNHSFTVFVYNINSLSPVQSIKVFGQKPCQYCHELFDPMKIVGHELTCEKAPPPASREFVDSLAEEPCDETPEQIRSHIDKMVKR